jgi:hypothetical protein
MCGIFAISVGSDCALAHVIRDKFARTQALRPMAINLIRLAKTTRTLNPLHFEDLESHRFEETSYAMREGSGSALSWVEWARARQCQANAPEPGRRGRCARNHRVRAVNGRRVLSL